MVDKGVRGMTQKKIVVLCDGTWAGSSNASDSNIQWLTYAITGVLPDGKNNGFWAREKEEGGSEGEGKKETSLLLVHYFAGVAGGGGEEKAEREMSLIDRAFNGITGFDIDERCKEVYSFIVSHYDGAGDEIWMFGGSRGAYTVRAVAGMINNCGILRRGPSLASEEWSPEKRRALEDEAYRLYRSRDPMDAPNVPRGRAELFRERFSHPRGETPPIRYLGLIDTVGSLGIPRFAAGQALEYAEFYDQIVSSEVQSVYQALAIHDRLFGFEPCFVRRKEKRENYKDVDFETSEMWIPGAHYDLLRQSFYLARDRGVTVLSLLWAIILMPFRALFRLGQEVLMLLRKGKISTLFCSLPRAIGAVLADLMSSLSLLLLDFLETTVHYKSATVRGRPDVVPNSLYADYTLGWILGSVRALDATLAAHQPVPVGAVWPSLDVYDELLAIVGRFLPLNPTLERKLLLRDRWIPFTVPRTEIYFASAEELRSSKAYPSKAYDTYDLVAEKIPTIAITEKPTEVIPE